MVKLKDFLPRLNLPKGYTFQVKYPFDELTFKKEGKGFSYEEVRQVNSQWIPAIGLLEHPVEDIHLSLELSPKLVVSVGNRQ